jgi:hypothetical protein
MADLELLARFAAQKMPVRPADADEFKGAQALAAKGYIKLAIPPVQKGRDTYGQQAPALILAITPAGKRALPGSAT